MHAHLALLIADDDERMPEKLDREEVPWIRDLLDTADAQPILAEESLNLPRVPLLGYVAPAGQR